MEDELNEQPIAPEEIPGLNPDPADLREDARRAADEATGEDVRDKIREVVDVPIDDMIRNAADDSNFGDDGDQDDVIDVPIDDMMDDDVSADTSHPPAPQERPKHLGVDPQAILRARQARAADAKKGNKSPRKTTAQKDAWLQWYRMSQGMAPEADDEPVDVPIDDLQRPKDGESVARASDRKNDVDVLVPQGNDKELNDQVVEMLRRYLDQERAWKRSILQTLEQALQMLIADHSRLEVIEAAFERGRESY